MKIKNLNLSDKVILSVADDIAKNFTVPKYEQFLTRRDLLSYNPNDFSYFNKINFIRDSIGGIDKRLLIELDKVNILSDYTREALAQEGIVFESVEASDKVSRQQIESTFSQTSLKVDRSKEIPQATKSIKDNKKPSLPYFLVTFLVILISLVFVRANVPDNTIFSLIVIAAIIILIIIGVLSLKHDDKISDDTFVNVIEKIQKMMGVFQAKK